jgi:hypothetical protein
LSGDAGHEDFISDVSHNHDAASVRRKFGSVNFRLRYHLCVSATPASISFQRQVAPLRVRRVKWPDDTLAFHAAPFHSMIHFRLRVAGRLI